MGGLAWHVLPHAAHLCGGGCSGGCDAVGDCASTGRSCVQEEQCTRGKTPAWRQRFDKRRWQGECACAGRGALCTAPAVSQLLALASVGAANLQNRVGVSCLALHFHSTFHCRLAEVKKLPDFIQGQYKKRVGTREGTVSEALMARILEEERGVGEAG